MRMTTKLIENKLEKHWVTPSLLRFYFARVLSGEYSTFDTLSALLSLDRVEPKCVSCGKHGNNVTFETNPYNVEIMGDRTRFWECAACREEAASDI